MDQRHHHHDDDDSNKRRDGAAPEADPAAATAAEREPEASAESPAAAGEAERESAVEPAAAEAAAEDAVAEEAEAPGRDAGLVEAELAETKERLLRTLAEMENLRRRTQREVEDARRYAVTGFARDLLEVADNLGRAVQSIPERVKGEVGYVKNLAEGVEMTEKALLATFERHRITRVDPKPGDRFDPNRHQAMFEVETAEHPPGTIAQVLQDGYVIEDRLLRPAMVGVAKAKPEQAAAAEAEEEEGPGAAAERDAGGEDRPGERVDTTA